MTAPELPPIQPGEARALIDETGETVIFQTRHTMSVRPEPDATIQMPVDQLLLVVAQAVLQREAVRRSGKIVTPSALPGARGPRPM